MAGEPVLGAVALRRAVGAGARLRRRGGGLSGQERIALHARLEGHHRTAAQAEHHAGIPLGGLRSPAKTQVHIRPLGPEVEVRSLAAYECATGGTR